MEFLTSALLVSQLIFTVTAVIFFCRSMKTSPGPSGECRLGDAQSRSEALRKLREIKLSEPLAEKMRPQSLEDIQGQKLAIKALRGAVCGKNPHHVLIYGPPGVGKTAAARLILEEAKKQPFSPFGDFSKFIELDATTLRFDERSIADPLMGSVHDPIYQGAGAYGSAGIPQPKPGAVTEAHGGVLFIDEIGELHPVQMNKLLKVLEDRVVRFTSSYYNEDSKTIPSFIHDVFKNGMPADFRLIGATTRRPSEIPQALRSRCTEIFFEDLKREHIIKIGSNAILAAGLTCEPECAKKIASYARNGRDAVNMAELAAASAEMEKRSEVTIADIEWIAEAGRYSPLISGKIRKSPEIGIVNGLAVIGGGSGSLLPVEAAASPAREKGAGSLTVTGIAHEETLENGSSRLKRKSTAMSSMENVLTTLEGFANIDARDYNIHINFPGGAIVDGPSAGTAVFCAVYSAIFGIKPDNKTAMTGEISIHGDVLPVGGVAAKIAGAAEAGAERVIIPRKNYSKPLEKYGVDIICADNISAVVETALGIALKPNNSCEDKQNSPEESILTASGLLKQ